VITNKRSRVTCPVIISPKATAARRSRKSARDYAQEERRRRSGRTARRGTLNWPGVIILLSEKMADGMLTESMLVRSAK